jgi:hypothetical protein
MPVAQNSISKLSNQLLISLKSSIKICDEVSTSINPTLSRQETPSVDILSLHANQQLVGCKSRPELLYIYSITGDLINTKIKATIQSKCMDAVWTLKYQIVCTVGRGIELVNSSDGRILASHLANMPVF